MAGLHHKLELWNWFLLSSQADMSILQERFDLARNMRLDVLPISRAKHELWLLMALAALLHALMRSDDSDEMLCSETILIGRATLYTDSLDWHTTQSKVLGVFHNR